MVSRSEDLRHAEGLDESVQKCPRISSTWGKKKILQPPLYSAASFFQLKLQQPGDSCGSRCGRPRITLVASEAVEKKRAARSIYTPLRKPRPSRGASQSASCSTHSSSHWSAFPAPLCTCFCPFQHKETLLYTKIGHMVLS